MVHGVGLIGAGPGVAALHLPTLARLATDFRPVHIADSGSGRAQEIAARVGARSSSGSADLLADPDVTVVAICSPPDRHAQQVLDAVAAGVGAIMCEKPIALTEDDARRVVEACRVAGTSLIVGTNHLFDPAWGRAKHHLSASGGPVRSVNISLALPPNGRYHELVSELDASAGPGGGRPAPDWSNPHVAGAIVRQLVIGLGVHDLPALRDIVPMIDRVVYARPLSPIGYVLGAVAGDVAVQLSAVMLPDGADALWRITVITELDRVEVEFPPAFVHDGSARVRVWGPNEHLTEYPRERNDGYLEEWLALAALLDGGEPVEYDSILDDAIFAIRLADAARDAVTGADALIGGGVR
ncbi:Gfo/Idh/MocA family protein [Naasia lichenicola]|uniref:Gfo/Idh/MocA family oxidoreductase n=1 Tax=Naasia lichenicola TaxID=2565933 RepID=A0A4S4FPW7_9MICO|nr:Gfo/Idh/MocA family oxidoreductase [Naasia lichenicola]THG31635.1 Gfo/Idh/MocA family oxidoreductase [Naasia lichenicola]